MGPVAVEAGSALVDLPDEHSAHTDLPVTLVYVPWEHAWHVDPAVPPLNVPTGQDVQFTPPVEAW